MQLTYLVKLLSYSTACSCYLLLQTSVATTVTTNPR